jgi:hypothetical protein
VVNKASAEEGGFNARHLASAWGRIWRFEGQIEDTKKLAGKLAELTRRVKPTTRHLKPDISNQNPETLNPKPETLSLKPDTRNPKPATLNPKPETLDPKTENRNLDASTRDPKPDGGRDGRKERGFSGACDGQAAGERLSPRISVSCEGTTKMLDYY